jgi:hypothetical protein
LDKTTSDLKSRIDVTDEKLKEEEVWAEKFAKKNMFFETF